MTTEISWRVELAVKPGQLEALRALTAEMVRFAREERGVLDYERYVSGDGTTVHVYERYSDSDAAHAHLDAFHRRFAERFSALVERKRFSVYGEPDAALRQVLDRFGPEYLQPLAGFSNRWLS